MKNLSRLPLIIRHEFMAIAAKKSFIVMTILIPLICLACIGLPWLLTKINTGDQENVAFVDKSGRYGKALVDTEEFHFEDITPIGDTGLKDFFANTDHLYAIAVIPADIDSSLSITIYSDNAIRHSLQKHIENCLNDSLTQARIQSYGIPELDKILSESKAEVELNCIKWTDEGDEEESNADIAGIVGMILSMLTYMFVLMYGAMIMSSVTEEKTNRIVEVIVSCCKPIELMFGKIIGVGLVGLFQMAIWFILIIIASTIFGIGMISSQPDMMQQTAQIASTQETQEIITELTKGLSSINFTEIFICFALYFIGGYLLYGSLFAAFGSAADQPSDASQATTPMIMIMVFALWVGIACMENPDGNLAWWCSIIPFTSPIVMMVRLPYDVPVWEIVISVVILFATAVATTAMSAKIYRTGILLYGKKFSWKTMLKWLK